MRPAGLGAPGMAAHVTPPLRDWKIPPPGPSAHAQIRSACELYTTLLNEPVTAGVVFGPSTTLQVPPRSVDMMRPCLPHVAKTLLAVRGSTVIRLIGVVPTMLTALTVKFHRVPSHLPLTRP